MTNYSELKSMIKALTKQDDHFWWSRVLRGCYEADGYLVSADTMSVILKGETSVGVSLHLINLETMEHHYSNLTLRLDRDKPTICGYDQELGVHDINVDYYDSESSTYAEYLDCTGELPEGCTIYISEETEAEILRQLKIAIQKQFADPTWNDHCDDKTRTRVTEYMKIS